MTEMPIRPPWCHTVTQIKVACRADAFAEVVAEQQIAADVNEQDRPVQCAEVSHQVPRGQYRNVAGGPGLQKCIASVNQSITARKNSRSA